MRSWLQNTWCITDNSNIPTIAIICNMYSWYKCCENNLQKWNMQQSGSLNFSNILWLLKGEIFEWPDNELVQLPGSWNLGYEMFSVYKPDTNHIAIIISP